MVPWGVVVLCGVPGLGAQEIGTLGVGDRVRIHSDAVVHLRTHGQVEEVTSEGLRIRERSDGPARLLAFEHMTRLEREVRSGRATVHGGVVGALAGLLTGIAIIGAEQANDQIDPACGKLHCYSSGFVLGTTAVGLIVGALTGSRVRLSVWERVDPSGRDR